MNRTPCKHGADTVQKPCKPCGAKTRVGTPCKRLDTAHSGRCRLHGGKSTGPTTEAGKQQARINGRLGGRKPKVQVFSGSMPAPQATTLPKTSPVPSAGNRTEMLGIPPSASKPLIRCCDCKHLSAAFTCLTRHTISIANEPRDCAEPRDW